MTPYAQGYRDALEEAARVAENSAKTSYRLMVEAKRVYSMETAAQLQCVSEAESSLARKLRIIPIPEIEERK